VTSHLNNATAFAAAARKELFRQVQHFSQPIQHDYFQLGTRWTRDLEFCAEMIKMIKSVKLSHFATSLPLLRQKKDTFVIDEIILR